MNGITALQDTQPKVPMENERKRLSYGAEKRQSRNLSSQFAEEEHEGNPQPLQEDLFLNLASTASTDTGDVEMADKSREKRRVSHFFLQMRCQAKRTMVLCSISSENAPVPSFCVLYRFSILV